jgi:hypothetical protein
LAIIPMWRIVFAVILTVPLQCGGFVNVSWPNLTNWNNC